MANPYDINPYNVASSTPAPTPPSTSSGQAPPPAPAQPFDNTALGIGVNTVKNLALGLFPGMLPADENPYIQTTKDIFQGFARAVGSAGLSITRPFRENTIDGRDTLAASDVSQNPTFQKLWQGVFGTTPIPELATSVADMEKSIKGSSFAINTGLDKHALPLAFAGVLGGESLNFVPFGGTEEGAVRALARETDPTKIIGILGKLGVDQSIAEKAAEHLAQTSDPTEIKATLSTLEGVQATQGAAAPKRTPEEIQQIVGDLTKKSGGEITTADKLPAKESPPSPPLLEPAQKAPFEEPLRGEGSIKSPAEAAVAYKAKFIDEPNANDALVEISGDEMKKLNGGDYAPERSSLYSTEAYNLVKDEIAQGPKKDIVFLGGGSGSGKSELIGNDLKDSGFTGLLYDNSLSNYSGTKRLLDLAKENGKNVEIHAILPDLDRARFFTLQRAIETGRPVTDADFARSHAGFVETLIKLLENGDLMPEQVHLFDTRGAEVEIPNDVLATLKSARYTEADILKNHGEETVAAKYENIPPPQRLRSLKNARQEAQPEDRLPQKERPADAFQRMERGANKEISGSPPTPQERGKAAGQSLESEWKQAGFATKKDYEAALRDIASYGESDKSDAVRRIIAGKLPMKPSPSTASEWKAIFGKRYYSVFKKNAGSAPDDMAAQLGYESEHELLHDVADEVYRRYNETPTRKAAAPKGAMRTLTEAIRKPDDVLPVKPTEAKPPVPPEDEGLVPRGTTVGEGIQADKPIEDGTPKVIRDQLPPSVGDVIANGKSYAVEATPAHAMQEIAQGADGKSWQSLVRGYMYNFSPEKKAHIFDYLATPEFVLEKLGLGKGAEMLQDAKDAYRNTLKKEFATIADWQARVKGDPYAKQIIFQYLDGREKDMVREMSPEEHAVAREIRGYLQDWAYRLKLPEDNQLSRYITHIFERDLTGPTESQFVDPELSAIMSENVAKSVYDPFLQKRLGKPGYVEDVWRALDAYVKRAARKEAMDPALEQIAEMAKNLDTTTYNYVRDLSHRVNLRPTEIETAMDSFIKQIPWVGGRFTDRPLAFLSRKVRGIFYRGTLGLNFSSTLRNLSQGANTYAKLGEKYTVVGYTKLFSKMAARDLSELSDQNILMDELVQDRQVGVIRKNVQRADNVLFGMFELAEKINRGAAYYGAKAQALNKGLSEEQAIKYAKRIVRETQFAFGAVDTPVWMNDDLVKTLTQLQTYNVKQAEFLKRMVAQKDFVGLMRWSGSSFAFLYTVGKLFGMTPAQLVPTIGLGGAPLTSTLSSVAGLSSSDAQTKAKAITQLQRNFFTLLPAGAQLRKTLQGAHDLERGADLTPAGHVRYPVNPDDALQALLFGPSSLSQAQEYFGSVGKKKTAPTGNPYNQ